MDIEWVRDLVICISGLVVTGVLIFIAVLSYSFYHRTRAVLDSIQATSSTMQEIFSYIEDEVVKPVIQVVALVEGIRQGIDTITKFFKKEEGGRNG
ncbi:MAG TPA: hypothetical protein G4O12_02090 [Dehalococcoidia bacterium]|nr:hypothetical protein [Dehalococcoidia bacterium]